MDTHTENQETHAKSTNSSQARKGLQIHAINFRNINVTENFTLFWKALLLFSHKVMSNPYSWPDFSVQGIYQARILEWVTISFSRESFQPRDQTGVSCIVGRFFTAKPPRKPSGVPNSVIQIQNSRGEQDESK